MANVHPPEALPQILNETPIGADAPQLGDWSALWRSSLAGGEDLSSTGQHQRVLPVLGVIALVVSLKPMRSLRPQAAHVLSMSRDHAEDPFGWIIRDSLELHHLA